MRYRTENKSKLRKRKFTILVSIVTMLVVMLGAGAAFAYPYIQDVVIPKKQLARAIENEYGNILNQINVKLEQIQNQKTDSGVRYTGTFTLNQQMVNQRDLMDDLKVDTVAFDLDVQTQAQTITGQFDLKNGQNGESKLKVQIYADAAGVMIKIPNLFEESVTLNYSDTGYEKEISIAWKSVISVLGNPDAKDIDQYTTSIEAAAKDVISGLKVIFEKSQIKKNSDIQIDGVNGKEKVSVLEITVTPDTIYKGIETAVNNAYADQELNSYLTLVATYTGMSKNEILEHCNEMTSKMDEIPLTVCISKEDRILSFDLKLNQPALGIDLEIIAGSIENQKITDHVTYELFVNSADGITSLWNEYVSEMLLSGCSGRFILSRNQTQYTLQELNIAGNVRATIPGEFTENGKQQVKEANVDLGFQGQCTKERTELKTQDELKQQKDKYKNHIFDLYHYNQIQENHITTQINQNSPIIRALCSDRIYDTYFK